MRPRDGEALVVGTRGAGARVGPDRQGVPLEVLVGGLIETTQPGGVTLRAVVAGGQLRQRAERLAVTRRELLTDQALPEELGCVRREELVELLLRLSVVPRFVVAIVIAFAPVFLANLVFARRFRDVAASNLAFAANLLGAMVGGVLEYVSLLTGYRALLILIAVLYAGAFVLQRVQQHRPVSPA